EGLPLPAHALLQRGQRHALHPGHHAPDVVAVVRLEGRQGEPAVAADHGGDAVNVGRGGPRVPEQLRVVVGVGVDEAGGDHQATGVERGAGVVVDLAHAGYAPCADPHVRSHGRGPGAVHQGGSPDQVVEHATSIEASHGG